MLRLTPARLALLGGSGRGRGLRVRLEPIHCGGGEFMGKEPVEYVGRRGEVPDADKRQIDDVLSGAKAGDQDLRVEIEAIAPSPRPQIQASSTRSSGDRFKVAVT